MSNLPDRIELTIHIEAEPEVVFEYFTQAEKLITWIGIRAELDAVPEGVFWLQQTPRTWVRGRFLEVTRPSRVVLSWEWGGADHPVPPGPSRVEITLVPQAGGTSVRLVHLDLTSGQGPRHRVGWRHYLDRLVLAASGRNPGPDPRAITQPAAPNEQAR